MPQVWQVVRGRWAPGLETRSPQKQNALRPGPGTGHPRQQGEAWPTTVQYWGVLAWDPGGAASPGSGEEDSWAGRRPQQGQAARQQVTDQEAKGRPGRGAVMGSKARSPGDTLGSSPVGSRCPGSRTSDKHPGLDTPEESHLWGKIPRFQKWTGRRRTLKSQAS